jgi:hypothetical protein
VTGAADNLRTGWYRDEPYLSPQFVNTERFRQAFSDSVTGQVYAQPLSAGRTLLVVTEDDWAYGLDAVTGVRLWERRLGTPVNSLEAPIECPDIQPHVGVTGTPVIDTERNIAYLVANEIVEGRIAWRMHALELASGRDAPGFPVSIRGSAQNLPGVTFEAAQQLQRPALLMMNGVVYAGFGSHCDKPPFEGWIAGVSSAGALTTLWAASANGASIWQAGGGLISDRPGQIIFTSGNGGGLSGSGDPPPGPGASPPEGRLGESVVRLEAQPGGTLRPIDFFSPFNSKLLDESDIDLGAAAPVALPSEYFGTASVPDLLVQDGKYGTVYLLNRDSLGGMGQGGGGGDAVVQRLGPYGGIWGAPAVWPGDGGYVYVPTVSEPASSNETSNRLRFFRYGVEGGSPRLSPAAETPDQEAFGSGSPIVTSAGANGGSALVWTIWCPAKACLEKEAELRAYSAVPSSGAPTPVWTEKIGLASKFSRPEAAGGHIYLANREGRVTAFSGPFTPSSSFLELGSTTVGGQLSGVVTFTATGKQPIEIRGARGTSSSPFATTGLPASGLTLTQGQVVTVGVTFRAPTAGRFTDSIAVTTQLGEYIVGVGATASAPSVAAASAVAPAPIVREPIPNLTKLKVRARASRLSSPRNKKLSVSYNLSVSATVSAVVYHRVISHRCRHGARRCTRWARTRVKLRIHGRKGKDLLTLKLGSLPAGDYRLTATPVNGEGVRGKTRHLEFKTFH